jgi:hypothetical protein
LIGRVFLLDRLRTLSYIAACVVLAACPGPPRPLVPEPLAPASRDSATAWTRARLPRAPALIRFRWRYEDNRGRHAGRGTARIAPPDSLRFDYAGPLGLGSGAAVLIGDRVAWADPEESFRSLVPAVPMLWAALGVVQPPAEDASVFGFADTAGVARRRVWRFVDAGDTLDYVVTGAVADSGTGARGRTLAAEWRRRGKAVARSHSQLDSLGRPASARVDFPEGSARFELTVVSIDTTAVFPPAIWRSRR